MFLTSHNLSLVVPSTEDSITVQAEDWLLGISLTLQPIMQSRNHHCHISGLPYSAAEAGIFVGHFIAFRYVSKFSQLTESTALCIAAMLACLSPFMRRNART